MSDNVDTIRVELVTNGKERWRTLHPIGVHSTLLGYELIIPEGFVTDFDSVPRLPLVFLLNKGKSGTVAAIVHDYLYYIGVDRKIADDVFYELMLASGVSKHRAFTIWAGVRIGGWMAYNNHARNKAQEPRREP